MMRMQAMAATPQGAPMGTEAGEQDVSVTVSVRLTVSR
jgi:hypothetical protein